MGGHLEDIPQPSDLEPPHLHGHATEPTSPVVSMAAPCPAAESAADRGWGLVVAAGVCLWGLLAVGRAIPVAAFMESVREWRGSPAAQMALCPC